MYSSVEVGRIARSRRTVQADVGEEHYIGCVVGPQTKEDRVGMGWEQTVSGVSC